MAKCFEFFRTRQGKSKTKQCFILLLIVINHLLLFLDFALDLTYFFYIDFKSSTLRTSQGISIFLIPAFIYILGLHFYIRNFKKIGDLIDIGIWILLGPVACFLYPISFLFVFVQVEVRRFFRLVDIEFLVKSFPQIIIQSTNNYMNNSWSHFAKLSLTTSIMSVIWHSARQVYCWHDRQHLAFLKNIEERVVGSVHSELPIPLNIEINEVGTHRDIYQENTYNFIKKKYYEKFNYIHFIFDSKINSISEIENDNSKVSIDERLNFYYTQHYNFQISWNTGIKKYLHPGILFFCHFLIMAIVWLGNLAYVISADFHLEYERFICLFFIGVAYLVSIFWSFDKDKSHIIKKCFCLKMCTYSLFEPIIKCLYNNEIKTKKRIVNEILNLLLGWIPLIIIEGSNNYRVEKSGGIYSAVIILNLIYLFMGACRIYYLVQLKLIAIENKNQSSVNPQLLE